MENITELLKRMDILVQYRPIELKKFAAIYIDVTIFNYFVKY